MTARSYPICVFLPTPARLYMFAVMERTQPDRCQIPLAVQRARNRRSGPSHSAAVTPSAWTPDILRRFLREARSPTRRTDKSGSHRSTAPTSHSSWLCVGKISTRAGLPMEAGWPLFPRERITRSSAFTTLQRSPFNSCRRRWTPTAFPHGHWMASASPLYAARQRRETHRRAFSSHLISHIHGPSGSLMPPRERRRKYGTAARRRRARFHTWPKTQAAA